MSHFVFKAKKPGGDTYSSEREAADRYELYRLIRESGDELVSFKEKPESRGLRMNIHLSLFGGRVKTSEKINFARNLGSMLDAGLALSRALSVLERQSRNKRFKAILTDLMSEIDKGSTFSGALGKYSKVFSPLFVSMVNAGEQSGTLSEALKGIATQMDSSYTLTRRVRGALMYPAVIVGVMIVIAILMFVFVIPVLLKTFTDLNVTLPLTTQIVLDLSNLVQNYGLLLLLCVLLALIALSWWSRRASGKDVIHAVLLKIPIVGGLVQEVNAARTARTLSSLLGSGVEVVESVRIAATVVQNVHFKAVLEAAMKAIEKGELMSKIFSQNEKLYPAFFAEMMGVGEETGKMGEMLLGVARYYESDVEQKTKDMSTVIEPFLIVLIGAAVGFFAVSMIQPMYSLVNAI